MASRRSPLIPQHDLTQLFANNFLWNLIGRITYFRGIGGARSTVTEDVRGKVRHKIGRTRDILNVGEEEEGHVASFGRWLRNPSEIVNEGGRRGGV